jgi:hypothetical protein
MRVLHLCPVGAEGLGAVREIALTPSLVPSELVDQPAVSRPPLSGAPREPFARVVPPPNRAKSTSSAASGIAASARV